MDGNTLNRIFRLTSFGESHGPSIGGVINGCPAGLLIDEEFIRKEMKRRTPANYLGSSSRKEPDTVEFLSGIFEGKTTGTPIAFLIKNKDQKSEDYDHLKSTFRPSHADFTYNRKYGIRDHRGGGRASARETAVRVAAGAIAKLLLQAHNIHIWGYVSAIGSISTPFPYTRLEMSNIEKSPLRCPDTEASNQMLDLLDQVKEAGDSVGGVVQCVVTGVPAGLGEPVFDRLEADLAKAMLSINAVKGFDIGMGVEAAKTFGSKHNDPFVNKDGQIETLSNHAGGVLGGISNGQDIYFRTFFKPVATIMQDQQTVDKDGQAVRLKGKGRHDVCVVPRAVPIVEAMTALTIVDFLLRARNNKVD